MDLTTRYLGLTLKNPLIASASPLTLELDNIRRLEDRGAAAVVLPSLFEEQIGHGLPTASPSGVDARRASSVQHSYFPSALRPRPESDNYLELIRRARAAVAIPVIASLNGTDPAGWNDYAPQVEQAGASAIELNPYFIPADPSRGVLEVEGTYLAVMHAVKACVSIPTAMKLSPYFSAIGAMATALAEAGANGLVLFNRFYQPDIDIATLKLSMNLDLSTRSEIRLPLRWIAILSGRIPLSLAASTGVETADEAFKYLIAGADAVMTTSSLLRHGIDHMRTLVDDLSTLLTARGISSIGEIRGRMSQRNIANPSAFERANYINILQSYNRNGTAW
jgi:dihydroorotate dehydrogenase (fumarate)